MSEEAVEKTETRETPSKHQRDWLGTFVGLAIFLGGIAILYTVFSQALELFRTPPRVELTVQPGKPVELASAFNGMMGVIVKILLLILMTWLGSVIANRGIFLYGHSRGRTGRKS
ncbi:MAG: hypothetical protein JST12_18015 [Armatimonadetes bacterium]|nr:hypothetical protein [Armatimonadota bacterium]MBS1703566.1 hypothetical protein [Armatimonadota bacterium]MBS1726690.1 hypothetical protein [Armatimonadota bacterium]